MKLLHIVSLEVLLGRNTVEFIAYLVIRGAVCWEGKLVKLLNIPSLLVLERIQVNVSTHIDTLRTLHFTYTIARLLHGGNTGQDIRYTDNVGTVWKRNWKFRTRLNAKKYI